jgi:trimethylguanosine synthase
MQRTELKKALPDKKAKAKAKAAVAADPMVSAMGESGDLKDQLLDAEPACPFGPDLDKYWKRREELFSGFDHRVVSIDAEGLFSITPELHALELGFSLPAECQTVFDAFCGAGGNAIGFARSGKRVIAVEMDLARLDMARMNAKAFGVEDRIEFIHGDARKELMSASHQFDCVFFDPPWGGSDYPKTAHSFSWDHFGDSHLSIPELLNTAAATGCCRRVICKVPRSFDLRELTSPDLRAFDVQLQRKSDARGNESYWVLHLTIPRAGAGQKQQQAPVQPSAAADSVPP